MTVKLIIGFIFFLWNVAAFAQPGGVVGKSTMKLMDKQRWQKAELKLRKTLDRDTLNPTVRYLLSVYYFRPENPSYDLDSAYHYAVQALTDYARTPERERDRLVKTSIDSLRLVALRAQIDSTAFEQARAQNTEAAYLEFLKEFPYAVQRELAERLRDEVAYQAAVRENTYKAFLSFLTRYPQAARAGEARTHYDRLLYEEETRDQRLASYEKFLAEHPETPYRNEIYRHIFEISTADGRVESFLGFMARYPVSALVRKAGQIVFHILADEEAPEWPDQFLTDSLRSVLELNTPYLVPVLKENRYGFMDGHGREVLAPTWERIHPDYLCGDITDDVLIVDDQLISRTGQVVYEGKVRAVSDLGLGLLKIDTGDGIKLVHKGGFVFADSLDDCRLLSKSYVTLNREGEWQLYTLAGRQLSETRWEDISALGEVLVFRKDERLYLAPKAQLARCADGVPLRLSEPFDEIRLWPGGLIWGRSGDYEGVLNQGLHRVIGFDKHRLRQTFFGALAEKPIGYTLYNGAGRRSPVFENVAILEPWATAKKSGRWTVFNPVSMRTESAPYDSVRVEGPFLIGVTADSVHVHFPKGGKLAFRGPTATTFIPGMDSTSFLLVGEGRIVSVYDLKGVKLFSGSFDGVQYAGEGIFAFTKNEKKGLVSLQGDVLLRPEYDAIGSARDGVISLLKSRKFGAWHAGQQKLIRPQYERNVQPYSNMLVSTFRDGFYGFLFWDNKPASAFSFDEILYWDDSTALVRTGAHWGFYEIFARKNMESNLRRITLVSDTPLEKIAIVQKDNNYGVISNRRGVIIPLTFTDVLNVGSKEHPLYFTEKHIREASLFIVIYYDEEGNMLRKEIYDDAVEYDRIYCPDN